MLSTFGQRRARETITADIFVTGSCVICVISVIDRRESVQCDAKRCRKLQSLMTQADGTVTQTRNANARNDANATTTA